MQISAKTLSKQTNREVTDHLALAISELRTVSESKSFLTGFLSKTEQVVLAKRLAIGLLLQKKVNYEDIKKRLSVSSATISGVAAMMKDPGFILAIEKVNREDWAEAQMHKIANFFQKKK